MSVEEQYIKKFIYKYMSKLDYFALRNGQCVTKIYVFRDNTCLMSLGSHFSAEFTYITWSFYEIVGYMIGLDIENDDESHDNINTITKIVMLKIKEDITEYLLKMSNHLGPRCITNDTKFEKYIGGDKINMKKENILSMRDEEIDTFKNY